MKAPLDVPPPPQHSACCSLVKYEVVIKSLVTGCVQHCGSAVPLSHKPCRQTACSWRAGRNYLFFFLLSFFLFWFFKGRCLQMLMQSHALISVVQIIFLCLGALLRCFVVQRSEPLILIRSYDMSQHVCRSAHGGWNSRCLMRYSSHHVQTIDWWQKWGGQKRRGAC